MVITAIKITILIIIIITICMILSINICSWNEKKLQTFLG